MRVLLLGANGLIGSSIAARLACAGFETLGLARRIDASARGLSVDRWIALDLRARIVVIADFMFTATAVLAQPVTGVLLAWTTGCSLGEGWILASILLYLLTGAFWLPVVWMQMRMRDLAAESARADTALPDAYHRLFRTWFAFGFPAFAAVLAIFWLMIARTEIGL